MTVFSKLFIRICAAVVVLSNLVWLPGCQSNRIPATVEISERDILAAAEPAIRSKYPDAYEGHTPYIAVPEPGARVWRVWPAVFPTPPGAPIAIVADDGRVLMVGLAE